eukprot:8283508-Alexandrium_andersonii.AAC.1
MPCQTPGGLQCAIYTVGRSPLSRPAPAPAFKLPTWLVSVRERARAVLFRRAGASKRRGGMCVARARLG